MHRINPEKLLNSKWTRKSPQGKEKHFMVTELIRDHDERVIACVLQAVMTRHEIDLDWRALKDSDIWLMGWK